MPKGEHLKGKGGVKFGEGQDPTKGGAPEGKRVSTILKELLSKDLSEFGITTKAEGVEGNKALALELISIAFHKDTSTRDKITAISQILDRIEGKAQANTDITSGGKTIVNLLNLRGNNTAEETE